MTEGQIANAVAKLFSGAGQICLAQVRNGVGFERRQNRTADMLIISTWPSRGLYASGVEIKSSAHDLRRELASPRKAEEIAQYCKYWWLAVPSGLADGELLPASWGLIEVCENGKAKVSRPAPEAAQYKPMDTLMCCAVLRAFSESMVSKEIVEVEIKKQVDARLKSTEERMKSKLEEWEKAAKAFEAHSGIMLVNRNGEPKYDFELREIGQAVKLVTAMRSLPSDEIEKAQGLLASASSLIAEAARLVKLQQRTS